MEKGLVSIIMPVYNGERYLREAIDSVIGQTYARWELFVINDGSTDDSLAIARAYKDPRIRVINQENNGVSGARNAGLNNMSGEFFCFLDADDVFTPESLEVRVRLFQEHAEVAFVDGVTHVWDESFTKKIRTYCPSFEGNPRRKLVQLSDEVFFGPTWMIRANSEVVYRFRTGLTHMEDCVFYFDISAKGRYTYTTEVILNYRKGEQTAMSNLKGLESGYFFFFHLVKKTGKFSTTELRSLIYKIRKIMILSYLANKQVLQAFRIFWKSTFTRLA